MQVHRLRFDNSEMASAVFVEMRERERLSIAPEGTTIDERCGCWIARALSGAVVVDAPSRSKT